MYGESVQGKGGKFRRSSVHRKCFFGTRMANVHHFGEFEGTSIYTWAITRESEYKMNDWQRLRWIWTLQLSPLL